MELAGDMGVPVGASVSADGYTLTADAMIGGRYSVAIVYTFTRDDGQPIPQGIDFEDWGTDLLSGAGGGGAFQIIRNEEAPHQVSLVETMSRSGPGGGARCWPRGPGS